MNGRHGLFDDFPENRFKDKPYAPSGPFNTYYVEIIFVFSFVVIAALFQHPITYYKINIPYEAFIQLLSIVAGILSKLHPTFDCYTLIANINPKLIMAMFFTSIIIYTVFSVDLYIITKCLGQILILGLPGFIMRATLIGSIMVKFVGQTSFQTWETIFLFGAICSTTQPKESLRVLKSVGEFKHISALLEGESLLCLSSSFFVYKIISETHEFKNNIFFMNVFYTCVVSIFTGTAIGRMVYYVLKWLDSNEAVFTYTVISISHLIYAPYQCLSRGLCLMSFLWVLHRMKLALSPTGDTFFQHIIEALGFISNTIIIAMTEIVIIEHILVNFKLYETIEIVGAFVTYFVTYMVRVVVLFILLPVLRKLGYYIPWQHMLIIAISGTSGSFALCLALTASRDSLLNMYNHKFLLCTSVMVLFSVIINPLFLTWLIKKLRLNQVDDAKVDNMAAIFEDMTKRRRCGLSALKANKEYSETNWNVVDNFTRIKHPYPWAEGADMTVIWEERKVSNQCSLCVKEQYHKGTSLDINTEANRRILQIKRINFRRQYGKGLLHIHELRLLEAAIDHASDTKTKVLNFKSMSDLWTGNWFLEKIRRRLLRIVFFSRHIKPPLNRFRYKMYKIIKLKYYGAVIFAWNFLSLVPFVYEWYYIKTDEKTLKLEIALDVIYVTFFIIFLSDFIIKLCAMGWRQYFKFWWNRIEFALLLCSILDLGLEMYKLFHLNEVNYWLKMVRILYLLRIIEMNMPRILMYIDNRILVGRLTGYNIAQCVIKTQEEIVKYTQYMSGKEGSSFEVEQRETFYKLEFQKDLDILQNDFPLVSITVKTKHAIRVILNKMNLHMEGLKEKGIIDDMESKLFQEIFNDKYNELRRKVLISSPLPSTAIKGIPLIADDKIVCDYLTECAELLFYQSGDEILSAGKKPNGLFVIISGEATSSYVYSKIADYNQKLYGMLPNCDFLMHLNFDDSQKHDTVLHPGTEFGEIGLLTDRPYNYTVICTSSVTVSFISKENIQKAFNLSTNFELQMWKAVSIKVASLKSYLPFKELSEDTLKYKLQNGYMFILHNCVSLDLNKFSGYIFLLEGTMEDKTNNTKYIAPTYFAKTSQNLTFFDNSVTKGFKALSTHFDKKHKERVNIKILVVRKFDGNINMIDDGSGHYSLIEDQVSSLCEHHQKNPPMELEMQTSFPQEERNEDHLDVPRISKLLKPFKTLNKESNTTSN